MKLFVPLAPPARWHPVFRMLMTPEFRPERYVLETWAEGFRDRDGKFVFEFQTTFESSLWELYLFACLKELGAAVNLQHARPDFVVDSPRGFSMEATITQPAKGDPGAIGFDPRAIPEDFNAFNAQAAIRLSNGLSEKVKKYRNGYRHIEQVRDRPYVIAIAPFDRPYAHFAASRPIMAALYGVHYDEEAVGPGAKKIPKVRVEDAIKPNGSPVPLGFFTSDQFKEVSAVIYSCLGGWGKVRALAPNPDAFSIYQTFHPSDDGITPRFRATWKRDYHEHLLDGLHIFHNPFAERPLAPEVLGHDRVAQFFVGADGLRTIEPDDFLLMRMIRTLRFTD